MMKRYGYNRPWTQEEDTQLLELVNLEALKWGSCLFYHLFFAVSAAWQSMGYYRKGNEAV
jgi:hypothetical protein